MKPFKNIVYSFDSFTLDVMERRLWKGNEPVALTPKAFDTLLVLLEHKGKIVAKDQLLDEVWKDTFVEESTLAQNISTLRKALGQLSDGTQFIETVPRRGYRFLAAVNESATDEEIIVVERRHKTEISAQQQRFTDDVPVAATAASVSPIYSVSILSNWLLRNTMIAAASVIAIAAVATGLWYGIGLNSRSKLLSANAFAHTQVTRLTSEGNIDLVKVSPSGNLLAMVQRNGDLASLQLRQIDNSTTIEIVPPKRQQFAGVTFSANDQQIYFVTYERSNQTGRGLIGMLYKVPSMGGQLEQLAADVDSPISIAPDGKNYAFIRNLLPEHQSAIVLSNFDSKEEKQLAVRQLGQYFSPTGVAWSPDGKTIAAIAIGEDGNVGIIGIDSKTAEMRPLTSTKWKWAGFPNWLSDGSGLIVSAFSGAAGDESDEVWKISVPDGSVQKLAGGTKGVLGLSMTADSRRVVAVESKLISSFWTSATGTQKDAAEIKRNLGETDIEPTGIHWSTDGKILYSSVLNGNVDIWMMDADGRNPRQITTEGAADTMPVALNDGGTLVFVSNRSGDRQLWRMNLDGTDQRQISNCSSVSFPSVATGGADIYYTAFDHTTQLPSLYRVSQNGGEATQVTSMPVLMPQVSPDGKYIAGYVQKAGVEGSGFNHLTPTILYAESGKIARQFEAELWTRLSPMVWSDSEHFNYAVSDGMHSRLWRQSINENSATVILDFPKDRIFRYAWKPDGRELAFESGQSINDVILIRSSDD
jgi:DNA-binding winged helix-turn-helix (wHTH) protein/Tol biopolymer transport system component